MYNVHSGPDQRVLPDWHHYGQQGQTQTGLNQTKPGRLQVSLTFL